MQPAMQGCGLDCPETAIWISAGNGNIRIIVVKFVHSTGRNFRSLTVNEPQNLPHSAFIRASNQYLPERLNFQPRSLCFGHGKQI
ncbi:MAG: hypothetical protein GY789_22625 [Hyphomicrobiales bacterium]|nr:hypothetical protein [Hyphomicrobiales bacterium]MCP4997412.1 hypothetical protein [Hyphomicrobiales bacterium]